jgi:membrane protein implicated in regulation of membrane protease activity
MQAWQWMVLGGVLVLLELATPSLFFFAWLALGALVAAIVAWLAPALIWQVQALVFAIAAGAGVLTWFRFRPTPASPGEPGLNRRAASLVGTRLTLDRKIENGRGRARVGDSSWAISGPDLPAGTAVTVVDVDGNRLVVAVGPPLYDDRPEAD